MLKLKRRVRNVAKYSDVANGIPLTTNVDDILNDPDIDIVVKLLVANSQRTIILLGHFKIKSMW